MVDQPVQAQTAQVVESVGWMSAAERVHLFDFLIRYANSALKLHLLLSFAEHPDWESTIRVLGEGLGCGEPALQAALADFLRDRIVTQRVAGTAVLFRLSRSAAVRQNVELLTRGERDQASG